MYIFQCEDSLDGIFTGIYDAWASGYGHNNVKLTTSLTENFELFAQYITVTTDPEKAMKVHRTLKKRFSYDAFSILCLAASSYQDDKADMLYKTIVYAFTLPNESSALEADAIPFIRAVNKYAKNANNECHHLYGFLRFSELYSNILFAKITPKNNIISFLTNHFDNRMPLENYMIYDEGRDIVALHKAHCQSLIALHPDFNKNAIEQFSDSEEQFRSLWQEFFDSIAIEGRHNTNLQRQNMPLRFRSNQHEFRS